LEKQAAQAAAYLKLQGVDLASEDGKERLAQMRQQVLDEMIDQVLIEQAATAMGLTVSDAELDQEVQKTVEEAGGQEKFQTWLKDNQLTLEEFRRSLRDDLVANAVRDKVTSAIPEVAEQVHARHILLATRQEAENVLAQVKRGADFAQLAKQRSQDLSTKDNGGDLGFFPRGLMPQSLEDAAFSTAPGQFSSVVESPFGFHVLQVVEKSPARTISPEVRQSLEEETFVRWLEEQRAQAALEKFVQD